MKESSLKTVTQGNPYGEILFVFHGWAMNSSVWQTVKPRLEQDFMVTWVDLPGHGENKNITANTLDEIVDLIQPLLSKTNKLKQKIHLLGWSLGGLVVQALAHRSPQLFSSLSLVASSPKFSQADDWPHAMSVDVLDSFAESLQTNSDLTMKRFIALQFLGLKDCKQLQDDLLASILANPADAHALKVGLAILKSADYRAIKHELPQHWILAGHDRLIPRNMINDLKLIQPNAQITLLENAGHGPFITHADEFILSFKQFMSNTIF